MIPVLSEHPATNPESVRFLDALGVAGFQGEIDRSSASRLAVATDNSVYQVMPDAVVFPRSPDDVIRLCRLLSQREHRSVTVVPRGGGTGTNGQALSPGIVVDLSRHMAQILEFNPNENWIRIEPGVVLDDLNRHVQRAGLFFGPTLSPSSRATLGGMISTNASGKGSRIYGRTADHVLELDCVLIDGTRVTLQPIAAEEARRRARNPDREGRIYRTLLDTLERNADEIAARWPNLPRTLTGYDLKSARSSDGAGISLIPILAGSEGTLGFIVGAKLRLIPIPRAKRTIALGYAEFDHALSAAEQLVAADPTAIETIDSRILELAQKDAIWHKVAHLLDFGATHEAGTAHEADATTVAGAAPSLALPIRAVNLVEFAGANAEELDKRIATLIDALETSQGAPGAPIGIVRAKTDGDAAALWELRKKGVGLLGAMRGDRRPVPFVEDTAVPPAQLSSYVREFRQILDRAGLVYGMFGHVDVGCLHVRPALNLREPADQAQIRSISDQVVALVKRYGGVFWGEHGKGFRSEYVPEFFGPTLFSALCTLKAEFDPAGQLNPGKLAVAPRTGQSLVTIDGPLRGTHDRQIALQSQRHFDVAIHCNGNGQCFSTDPDTVMCPSSKLRRDRVHSPKGRAALIREWLRQLSRRGFDAGQQLRRQSRRPSERAGVERWFSTPGQAREPNHYDFSHEVYDALDGCLSCKACATQCPILVDIPRMKSEFLSLYHARYARPIRDYFVAALESLLMVLGFLPGFFNWWMRRTWVKFVLERWVGIVDPPQLARISLRRELERRGATWLDDSMVRQLRAMEPAKRDASVILLQDAFTTFYEPEVALATYDLMKAMGVTPLVVPFFANGKALVIKGFLSAFRTLGRRNAERLNHLAELGIPMVGIEPAVTLTYRDEYPELLGADSIRFRVELLQDWLVQESRRLRDAIKPKHAPTGPRALLFGHCTERTAAPQSQQSWERVFSAAGIDLDTANVGCCGMCGVFGLEAAHVEESKGVYAMSWQPKLQATKNDSTTRMATGHSCRNQAMRVDGIRLPHPIEVLLRGVV